MPTPHVRWGTQTQCRGKLVWVLTLPLIVATAASSRDASAKIGYAPRVDYATGANASQMAIGDVNRDGRLDLAVANNTTPGKVSVLLGNGAGGFGPRTEFTTGDGPLMVEIADVN